MQHEDQKLRGIILHLGGWSGRAAHSKPNTGNIVGVSKDKDKRILYGEAGSFGYECRDLWTVDKGNKLVGVDAEGIQLRIIAHYINNPEYTALVLDNIHDFNARVLDCPRPVAKTFIYSWLLGAGVAETARILDCSETMAKKKRKRFEQLTPGLKKFLKEVDETAKRGYYKGLDGRKVYVPNRHLTLTAYLQNGEHIIMALAKDIWHKEATAKGINFKLCMYVHDEWQTEVEEARAEELKEIQMASFAKAGEILKMNCPLAGAGDIGNSWAETH